MTSKASNEGKVSYAEILCRKSLELVVPRQDIEYNIRPDWLLNPDSGENLELDIYLPKSQLGIEVNGPTHADNKDQVARDKLKKLLCKDKGIGILRLSIFSLDPYTLYCKLKTLGVRLNQIGVHNIDEFNRLTSIVQKYKATILKKYRHTEYCKKHGSLTLSTTVARFKHSIDNTFRTHLRSNRVVKKK